MRTPQLTDTIVATSTPAGRSARAIVRLSGPDAARLASTVFETHEPVDTVPTYHSVEGAVVLRDSAIRCPAVAYVMRAPRSYTREDIVELHVPGSPPLLGALVDALTDAGARPAEAGEFTRRAFLNGRIDLTQAEAVQAAIAARSRAELRIAQSQLAGAFSNAVDRVRARVLQLAAEVEASIDFVEDDIRLVDPAEVRRRALRIAESVLELARRETPLPAKDGVRAALCGLPNAGKSSLLNALARADRALVAPQPGTTRDTVEHPLVIGDLRFRLIDTAGVRRARRAVESQAIARANRAAETADLVLLVIDAGRPLGPKAWDLWDRVTAPHAPPVITVLNKCDLPPRVGATDAERLAGRGPLVRASALRGDGLDDLRALMAARVRSGAVDCSAHGFWVTARHRAALRRAADAARRAADALARGLGLEFAAADLRETLAALDEITGRSASDDVLDLIFAQFCIGK